MKKFLFAVALLAAATAAWAAIGTSKPSQFIAIDPTNVPVSALSTWVTVRDAGGVDSADAAPLVNATSSITASTAHIFDIGNNGGTGVVVRFAYRGSVSTSPVIRVFGRANTTEAWQVLSNKSGDNAVTLAVDTTNDGTDGTDKFTTVVIDDHYFDAQGCRYILIGVQTAQSGGTASVSYIQAKSF